MLNTRKKAYQVAQEVSQPSKKTPLDHYLDISNNDSFRSNDYGKSKYDKYLNLATDVNTTDENTIARSLNKNRAEQQSGLAHLGTGLVRTAVKAAVEVAKLPGVIVGIPMGLAADENEGLETAFNNQWIKYFDSLNEDLKEALPVYTKEAVKNGDFFDKISSSSFWAEDGADGAGFMLGMLAPGAIFKWLGGAEALFGASIKAAKLAKYGEGMEAGRKALVEAGITINKIDQYMIPAFNTISEAGAEAKGVSDDLESRKGEFIATYTNSPQYQQDIISKNKELDTQRRNGEISLDEYNKLSANVANDIVEFKFKEQKALAMQNTFIKNVTVLAVPNYIQAKMLFGKTPSTALLDKIGGKLENAGWKQSVKEGVKRVGETFLSEGSEEIAQTAIQHRNTEMGLQGKLGDSRTDDYNPLTFGEDFVKTLGTTEGQIAGFLGGIMGSPISVISGHRQDIADRKQTERLRDKINGESTAYKDVVNTNIYEQEEYTNPERGEVSTRDKLVNGEKVFIPEAVAKVKNALDLNEVQSRAYDKAIKEGDVNTIEYLKGQAEFNLISKFIGEDEVTLDALGEYLKVAFPTEKSENISEDQVKTNKENLERVDKIMGKAKSLQKDLTSYKDMAASLIRIDNSEVTPDHLADFMNRVGQTFISERAEEFDAKDKLVKLQKQRAELESSSSVIKIDNPNYIEGKTEDIFKTTKTRSNNPRLELINSQIARVEEQLKDFEEATNSTIWDNEYLNNKINNEVDAKKRLQKASSPEEVAKNDEVIAKINEAITEEDIDNIQNNTIKTISQKEDELEILNNIKQRITEDPSLENLQNILETVKNSNFDHYEVNKVISSIENSIKNIIDERSQFEEIIFEIAEKYSNKNKEISDKIDDINKRIDNLINSKQLLKKSIPNTTKKSKNRILNKLIRETQSEIKKVDSEIKKLELEKTKLVKDLESINKNLDYLYLRLDQVSKVGFKNIDDIIKYLEDNKDRFGEHRFDITRLSTQQFYTEQNIEGLENVINHLEDYKSVLEQTIKDYLAADEEHSQDLYYLQRELENTIDSLNNSKKELSKEKDKILRINKSINDKLSKKALNKEIDFWDKIQKFKESKKQSNPIIQQKIEEKRQEIIESKKVEEAETINNAKEEDETFNGKSDTETYSTEGSTISNDLIPQTSENTTNEEDVEAKKKDSTEGKGVKLISYDRKNGEVLNFIKEQFPEGLAFERNPIDKKGKEVGFEINEKPGVKLAEEALAQFKAGNFKDIQFLIDYLPINIKLADRAYLPIETRRVTNEMNHETEMLRKSLITNLINGIPIESMNSTITGQYKGVLQVESPTAENSLLDLAGVTGLKYIKDNTYFVNIHGQLENVLTGQTKPFQNKFTKDLDRTKANAAGEIYLMVLQADGVSQFPLKLNIGKLTIEESEGLFEIYKDILTQDNGSNTTLSEISPELLNIIESTFSEELKVIAPTNKIKDIKLGEIIDLLVYESDNVKSRINVTEGILYFGEQSAHSNEIDALKEEIMYFLHTQKRHQIKIRPKSAEDNQRTNLASNSANYIKYLVEGKILSTNAVVNEPAFQGYTNLFISPTVTTKGSEKVVEEYKSVRSITNIEDRLKGIRTIQELSDGFKTLSKEQQDLYNPLFTEKRIEIENKGKVKVSDAGAEIDSKNWEGLDFGESEKPDKNIKKEIIKSQINNLSDDLLFITHITSNNNSKNIFDSNLLMPAGVSSTTGIVNKTQLTKILNDLIDGKSPHRGYLDMFIGSIDKNILQNNNGKSLQDKLENYLDENFIEDVAKTQLPSQLNFGYFTNGKLILENNSDNTRNYKNNSLSLPESTTVIEDLSDSNKFVSSSDIPNTVENKQQMDKQERVFKEPKGLEGQKDTKTITLLNDRIEKGKATEANLKQLETLKNKYGEDYIKKCK